MLQVHLLSLPWAHLNIPSIQVGALKSYLKKHLPEAQVYGHHFHLNVTADVFSTAQYTQEAYYALMHEGNFLRILLRHYAGDFPSGVDAEEFHQDLQDHYQKFAPPGRSLLNEETIDQLKTSLEMHLEKSIVAKAKDANQIVIGMTTNFFQIYANLCAYYYLKRRLPEKKMVFVFGGSSISYPQTMEMFQKHHIDAYGIVGEGEKKLLRFIEGFVADKELEDPQEGVFHVRSAQSLYHWNENWSRSQIQSIDDLPLPDFDEYFQHLTEGLIDHPDQLLLMKKVELPIEGSRGCVFACEFCNLNRFWQGYRKIPGEEIADRAALLMKTYRAPRVRFVDNLCDGWAQKYAEHLISQNLSLSSMMEIRPKHGREFWEKLKESGLQECQIGVEGLDPQILKRVNKGTTIRDIISAQKSLTEVGIVLGSRQIITFYPKSTLEEVRSTRRILENLLHLPKFDLGRFWLGIDSPLYNQLSREQREGLQTGTAGIRSLPEKYAALQIFFYYETPEEYEVKGEVREEWQGLKDWYASVDYFHWLDRSLTMEWIQDTLTVFDHRAATPVVRNLSPEEKELMLACAEGKTNEVLRDLFPQDVVEEVLPRFIREKLVLEIDRGFISLPLLLKRETLPELRKKIQSYLARLRM